MSNISGYKTKAYSENQKFFALDPNTGSPSLIPASEVASIKRLSSTQAGDGSDLVAYRDDGTVTDALNRRTIYVGSVAELEALSLPVGTAVYLTEEGRAGTGVIKSGSHAADPQKGVFIDLANGNYWHRQHSGVVNASWYGASTLSPDASVEIQAALNSGFSVTISEPYFARGLDITIDNVSVYFSKGGQIKNPDGVNGQDVLTVSAENVKIYDGVVDGNGQNDPGGTISVSVAGIKLNGRNNKAIRCIARFCGKRLTSGDQGANNQVGVGFGGASDDPTKPNIFEDCIAHDNGNYGFNPRSNTIIVRGSSYANGTNGVGNRLCSNFHVDGHYIGVQYQSNPDTASNGMTLDTESSSSPDYQKLSRDCSFKNIIIEAQEGKSISCSFYAETEFRDIHCFGDVLVQSSKPLVSPDLGNTGVVTIDNMRVDGEFKALQHQRLVLMGLKQNLPVSLGVNIDSVDDLEIEGLVTKATLARIIRCPNTAIRGFSSTELLDLDTISNLDAIQVEMDGISSVTDQKAIQLTTCKGKLKGYFKNYGYPIASTSGNFGMDLSGCAFEDCGAADGADQNACVNFKNTSDYILNGLRFVNCSGRLLYATGMNGGVVTGFNASANCSGGVTIEGSSDNFLYQSNVLRGTGTIRIFAGTNMGSTAYSNFTAPTITISAYPASWT